MSNPNIKMCLKPGACLDAQGKRINSCPSDREAERYVDTTPLLSAESLCINALRSFPDSRSDPRLVDDWSNICYDIDRAIAIPAVHMQDFQAALMRQIGTMLHRNNDRANWLDARHPLISLQMKRLGIFMPAFRVRILGGEVPVSLTQQVHRGLVGYIGDLDDQLHRFNGPHVIKKQIAAHKSECEVMALVSRTGQMPYPALDREEASHARKQHNHDFYTLRGGQKKPYQVKTSANGSGYKNVSVVRHYDILRGFHQDPVSHRVEWRPSRGHEDFEWPNPYRYEQVIEGEKLSPLAELLGEEVHCGNRLTQDKRNALALASGFVMSH